MKKFAVFALTQNGAVLADKLACAMPDDIDVFLSAKLNKGRGFTSLSFLLQKIFNDYQGHIFIAATGIVVRIIAPLLKGKNIDPAVIVCDQQGQFAISLLSGHWGGANDLAKQIAIITKGIPIITTATDVENLPAADLLAKKANYKIIDFSEIKTINAAILNQQTVQVYDPNNLLELCAPLQKIFAVPKNNCPAIVAHWRKLVAKPNLLRLAVPALYVGIGCRRGVSANDLKIALENTFENAGLEFLAVAAFASINEKNNEIGLLEMAKQFDLPIHFFSAEYLAKMPVQNISVKASNYFSTPNLGVCEGAALAAAKLDAVNSHVEAPVLLQSKVKYLNITIAIAINGKFNV